MMAIRRRSKYPMERARLLRREQSPPEGVLWSRLRGGRLQGFRFRRQHPIGPFVVDFACVQAKLVVELDSIYHDGLRQRDEQRDALLGGLGWSVLRFSASQLAKDERVVLETILHHCRDRT